MVRIGPLLPQHPVSSNVANPAFTFVPRLRAAVFLAKCQKAIVGYSEIVKGALANVAVVGARGEHKVGTTIALARRKRESYRDESIDDCEIAGIGVVIGDYRRLAAVRPAVAGIVGQSFYAVRADCRAADLVTSRRPILPVKLCAMAALWSCSAKAASVNAVAMNLIRLVIFLPPNDSLPSERRL